MRQRKAKDLKAKLAACSEFLLMPQNGQGTDQTDDNPRRKLVGECFGDSLIKSYEIFVEIGCGKGQFIIRKAIENPDAFFIGIEGQETVILRAAEKALAVSSKSGWQENVPGEESLNGLAGTLDNLKFVNCFVNGMEELFEENSLAGIYLNFSDPWPKARHAKRRLTYHERLRDYAWAIRSGGSIEIKTDNDDLFEFTLEEIAQVDCLEVCEMTRDLHVVCNERRDDACHVAYDARLVSGDTHHVADAARFVTTEYEDKFKKAGKNINYVKLIVR